MNKTIMTVWGLIVVLICGFLVYLGKKDEDKVYKNTIPRNIRLAESPSFGLPIMLYDEKCKGAKSYLDFTKEFLSKQN